MQRLEPNIFVPVVKPLFMASVHGLEGELQTDANAAES